MFAIITAIRTLGAPFAVRVRYPGIGGEVLLFLMAQRDANSGSTPVVTGPRADYRTVSVPIKILWGYFRGFFWRLAAQNIDL